MTDAGDRPHTRPEGTGDGWRRLDPRMLLVHPAREVSRLAVPLIAIVLVGSRGIDPWHSAVVAVPVLLGVWRYATTQFRITPEHVELRAGLVSRHITRARLDKVRTVALDASPIHRVLTLAKVRIGTGDNDGLELNALGTEEARALRASLLHRSGTVAAPGQDPGAAADDEVLLRFDPAWLRLAPFTGTGLLIAAAALAAASGPLQEPSVRVVESIAGNAEDVPVLPLVAGGALLALLVLSVLSVAGYALTNWGFTFSRDRGNRSWHIAKGLLSRTETSLDTTRVRGVSVCRGAGLRLVGGATARALVTGVKEEQGQSQQGSAPIAPAAPYPVVRALTRTLVRDDAALEAPLRGHPRRALRRQFIAALRTVVLVEVVVVAAAAGIDDPTWVVLLPVPLGLVAWLVARDRYRGLGHLLTADHLVIGAPKVNRHRHLLLRRGIIGWQLRQTWFQRRSGLVTLVATSAAGTRAYPIVDMDETDAAPLAHDAVPDLVSQFLR